MDPVGGILFSEITDGIRMRVSTSSESRDDVRPGWRVWMVGCHVDWTADGGALVVRLASDSGSFLTVVLALEPDRTLPNLPPAGIQSEAELAGLPVVSRRDGFLFLGLDDGQYAFTRGETIRNIYRVPLR